MADPTGFRQHPRRPAPRRPAPLRVLDWHEVHDRMEEGAVRTQAARCMDCGVPFCHRACPLGNVIPEWNDLARRGRWRQAAERLHATNNVPEFTGRLCPAPCEAACVLAITDRPVTIEHIEEEIAERAFSGGWVTAAPPAPATGRRVAVVGSGPAGLAAAQQLARAGHEVVVYERADRPGGLLRYGIPAFKLEKWVLERRLDQLRAEGVRFETGVEVGPQLDPRALRASVDALVLATGAPRPRDLPVPGRALAGIHQAMEYLPLANRVQEGDLAASPISARGRQVVIIGGGDTGADCLGTAHRQGAASVHQLEIMPRPPDDPDASTPWPLWPLRLRTSAAHEEGGVRLFALRTERFLDDGAGRVAGLQLTTVEPAVVDGRTIMTPVPGPPTDLPAELVLLALGFAGPEPAGLVAQLQLELRPQGPVARQPDFAAAPGVFVCGDMGRGQSLVVWAIAEGRSCAAAVDR
ncbi:MAG TPA: glutamate synthase subunit beta, partial [Candidatus Dormibacteraeota bacterium]|nr:glutamate synthase subunit beta [Candidatus Dormibacteraeota bacterium]